MTRRFESALLDSKVEMLELVVSELLKDVREQGEGWVRVRFLRVLLEDRLQVTKLAVCQSTSTYDPKQIVQILTRRNARR